MHFKSYVPAVCNSSVWESVKDELPLIPTSVKQPILIIEHTVHLTTKSYLLQQTCPKANCFLILDHYGGDHA